MKECLPPQGCSKDSVNLHVNFLACNRCSINVISREFPASIQPDTHVQEGPEVQRLVANVVLTADHEQPV